MKKHFFWLFLLTSLAVKAQEPANPLGSTKTAVKVLGRMYVDSALFVPVRKANWTPLRQAAITFDPDSLQFYGWYGDHWGLFGSGGGGGVVSKFGIEDNTGLQNRKNNLGAYNLDIVAGTSNFSARTSEIYIDSNSSQFFVQTVPGISSQIVTTGNGTDITTTKDNSTSHEGITVLPDSLVFSSFTPSASILLRFSPTRSIISRNSVDRDIATSVNGYPADATGNIISTLQTTTDAGAITTDSTTFRFNATNYIRLIGGQDRFVEHSDGGGKGISLYTHNSTSASIAPEINTYRSRGTEAAPTAVLINDDISWYSTRAHDGSAWGVGPKIISVASENWTAAHHGSRFDVSSIKIGTTLGFVAQRITASGTGFGNSVVGAPISTPTSQIQTVAQTTNAGSSPLKFGTGPLMTTPENGAWEATSTHVYYTIGGVRFQMDQQGGGGGGISVGDPDSLGGQRYDFYLNRANHVGTQLASTISDFNDAIGAAIHLTTIGSSGAATWDAATQTINVPNYTGGSAGSLTNSHIFVGNASDVPTDVAMSGDITINNAGVTLIGAGKVTNTKIAAMTSAQFAGIISDETGTGNVVFSKSPVFAAGTLTDGANALSINATMPSTIVTTNTAVNVQITSAGSSAFSNRAFNVDYLAGYTGTGLTSAARIVNAAAGTGSALLNAAGNLGANIAATGTTTGYNIAGYNAASNGDVNVGSFGKAVVAKNAATNIGVTGFALNTGTTPINIGGYFGLQSTDPVFTSAALMADNGATTDPILVLRDNGADVWTWANGGLAQIGSAALTTQKINMGAAAGTAAIGINTNGVIPAISTYSTGTQKTQFGNGISILNGGVLSIYTDQAITKTISFDGPTGIGYVTGKLAIGNTVPTALLTLGTAGVTLGNLSLAGNTSGTVTMRPAAIAGTWTFTLPATSGINGYVLATDGNGVTFWTPPTTTGLHVFNSFAASHTLALTDAAPAIGLMTSSSANSITVPANATVALPIGFESTFQQDGTGQTTIVAAAGVTVESSNGLKFRARKAVVTVIKKAVNTWTATGDLTP